MNKKTFARIWLSLKEYRLKLIISLFFAVVSSVLTLIVPFIIGKGIDVIVGVDNVDFTKLLNYLIVVLILSLIISITQFEMTRINNNIVYALSKKIRDQAFTKIQTLPLNYIDTHPYGEVVSRVITDVEAFQEGLLLAFTNFFTGIVTILGTLIFMFMINWLIALCVVVLTPLSLFVAKFISAKTYSLFKQQSQIRGEQTSLIDEMFNSLKTVQAYNQEEENINKFIEVNNRLSSCSFKATFISSLVNPSTRFINSLVYAFVCLFGALIATRTISTIGPLFVPLISVGTLSSLLSYANQYTKPFNEISSVISELQNSFACASRVFELLDTPSEEKDKEDAFTFTSVKGNVELKNVYFSYTKDKKLIQNFSLKAKKGQNIAIVGPTGCGKTTLINLLMRFYDIDEGSIKVDGKNIYDAKRKSLRRIYGMVLQDTWIKKASVKENIALGKPGATDEEIIEACKKAKCDSFIRRLENGYDTLISDEGNLSVGQKQLLCIARIMLCLPPLVILDEATSSIDTRTELKIQRAFNELTKDRTAFIVAHRLSTIKEADIILVMKDGNIVEQGNHEELLKLNGFYSELYNSQFAKN
ncbi:MAG: ABC transporter ATP-binding protein [Bacilli bacterium]